MEYIQSINESTSATCKPHKQIGEWKKPDTGDVCFIHVKFKESETNPWFQLSEYWWPSLGKWLWGGRRALLGAGNILFLDLNAENTGVYM